VGRIVKTLADLARGVVGVGFPLSPIVSKGRNLLGVGMVAIVRNAGVGAHTGLSTGRLGGYGDFVNMIIRLTVLVAIACVCCASSHVLAVAVCIDLYPPICPCMLTILGRTVTLCTIYNVIYAIFSIAPIILSVTAAGGFTGMILVIIALAIRTGNPVSELIVFGILSATLTFILVMRC
jgi:hypothetical protein